MSISLHFRRLPIVVRSSCRSPGLAGKLTGGFAVTGGHVSKNPPVAKDAESRP